MSTWKHIGCLSAALLPAILSKGCEDPAAPDDGISPSCDRTT